MSEITKKAYLVLLLLSILPIVFFIYGKGLDAQINDYKKYLEIRKDINIAYQQWLDKRISKEELSEAVFPHISSLKGLESKSSKWFIGDWKLNKIKELNSTLRLRELTNLYDYTRGYDSEEYSSEKAMNEDELKNIIEKRQRRIDLLIADMEKIIK